MEPIPETVEALEELEPIAGGEQILLVPPDRPPGSGNRSRLRWLECGVSRARRDLHIGGL